jgi:Fur family ferric uptake transcriptional regulator
MDIEAFCKKHDLRLTAARRVILQVLLGADDHPDATELHRRVTAIAPGVSLATVYRTLSVLEEKGALERHSFGDGAARFEPAQLQHHDHLIDVDTGQVIEFSSEEIERLQEEVARKHGFEIVSHKLEIYVRRPGQRRRE